MDPDNDPPPSVAATEGRGERAFRAFVSYSHEDFELAEAVTDVLQQIQVTPMWDRGFQIGRGFHEQIRLFIAYSHFFVPLVTESSSQKGWVQQEIGYAMALNIPVLPVALGKNPGEMIEQILAIRLEPGDQQDDHWRSRLTEQLKPEVIEILVSDYADPRQARFQSAALHEDRTQLMAEYANEVAQLNVSGDYGSGLLRQKGGLSSLHIPRLSISHPVWKERYGGIDRGLFHCRLQRAERLALEKHARRSGCRLIINPGMTFSKYGPKARIGRLLTLTDFLDTMSNEMAEVAFNDRLDVQESVTILGDWFCAEAMSAAIGLGFRQTNFTRHAPSMGARLALFDQEFSECLEHREWRPEESRERAVEELREIIEKVKEEHGTELS